MSADPPGADIYDWDERYAAALRLLELIGDRLPLLTSRLGDPRGLCGAALARCRRLSLAIDLQRANGFSDTLGSQLRSVFETWVNGIWLLLEPDVAYPALNGEYKHQVAKMDRLAVLGLPDIDGWEGENQPGRDLYSVTARIAKLLASVEGEDSARLATHTYHVLYRGESLRGSHAGLASFLMHLRIVDDRSETVEVRAEQAAAGQVALVTASSLTGHLASLVLQRFGVATEEIDRLSQRIGLPPSA